MTKVVIRDLLAIGFVFLVSMPPLGAAGVQGASDIQYDRILIPFFLREPLPGKLGSL